MWSRAYFVEERESVSLQTDFLQDAEGPNKARYQLPFSGLKAKILGRQAHKVAPFEELQRVSFVIVLSLNLDSIGSMVLELSP